MKSAAGSTSSVVIFPSSRSRSTVKALSNPLFVSFPGTSARTSQAAQVLVLTFLCDPHVAAPPADRLVAVEVKSITDIGRRANTKKSGKRVIQLDVENDQRTIREILYPSRFYMPNANTFKQRVVNLDEGHLHHTLSSWTSKTDLAKVMIVGSYMATTPTMTFTLRFSQDRQDKLKRHPHEVFRSMRNHLGDVKRLGPTAMTLEMDKAGRPHIHGMVATSASKEVVRAALWPAGGKSGNPGFNPHQLDVEPVGNALGWACYMTKDLLKLSESDAAPLIDLSNSARQAGEAHLRRLREVSRTKLGISPDMRGRAAFYSQADKSSIIVMPPSTSGMTSH